MAPPYAITFRGDLEEKLLKDGFFKENFLTAGF